MKIKYFLVFSFAAFFIGCAAKKKPQIIEQKSDSESLGKEVSLYYNSDSTYYVEKGMLENEKNGLPATISLVVNNELKKEIQINNKYHFIKWQNDSTLLLRITKGIVEDQSKELNKRKQENYVEYFYNIYTNEIKPLVYNKQ